MLNSAPKINKIEINLKKILPIQSAVKALGLTHPSAQEPLNASQCCFLHLFGHVVVHPTPYLFQSQPERK